MFPFSVSLIDRRTSSSASGCVPLLHAVRDEDLAWLRLSACDS